MTLTGEQLLRRVAAALTQVVDPRSGEDVVSSGRVRELDADDAGLVRFRFALQPEDPGVPDRHAQQRLPTSSSPGMSLVVSASHCTVAPSGPATRSDGGGTGIRRHSAGRCTPVWPRRRAYKLWRRPGAR